MSVLTESWFYREMWRKTFFKSKIMKSKFANCAVTSLYLNHSQVAIFGIGAEVKYVPLDVDGGYTGEEDKPQVKN